MAYDNDNLNNDLNNDLNINMTWDDPATPVIQPVIDPNGWHWYPDSNGNLFSLYFDTDGNECMMWRIQDDGSFYWRCANVGYICREIGIEDRRGIFFENHLVGTMLLDVNLTVTWLPETYINNITPHDQINNINIHYNINIEANQINDIYDETEDDYDP
jgi:hypothetical protein